MTKRTALVLVSTVLGVAILLLLGPQWYLGRLSELSVDERLKAYSDLRTSGIQFVGGVVLVVGAVYTARNFSLNRDAGRAAKFGDAAEALESQSLTRCASAAQVLRLLATEAPEYWDEVDALLGAYLREHAISDTTVSVDVQAALTAIGRRPRVGPHHRQRRLDLRGLKAIDVHLDGANLALLDLEDAKLAGASLRDASLVRTNLRTSDLKRANLGGADFTDANLENALVSADTDIFMAKLIRTCLRGVDLTGVRNYTSDALTTALRDDQEPLIS